MEHWQMDLTFMYNQILLTIIDCFSKFLILQLVPNKFASTIIKHLDKACRLYGYPVIMQTDNGSEFNNAELKEYCRSRYIQYRTSRAYKPNTQGQVERVHRTLKGAIRQDMELVNNTTDWVKYYEDYVQAYNTMTTGATGYTPFEVHMGYKSDWMPEGGMRVSDPVGTLVLDKFVSANPDIDVEWLMSNRDQILADEVLMVNTFVRPEDKKEIPPESLISPEKIGDSKVPDVPPDSTESILSQAGTNPISKRLFT
jgi:hypothetical protein